ncbi:hypothetical protein VRRI112168_06905 [Vreelandella rituensis]
MLRELYGVDRVNNNLVDNIPLSECISRNCFRELIPTD